MWFLFLCSYPDSALISDCTLDRKSNDYNKSTSVIPLFLESGVKASSLDRVPALHLAFCVSERLSTEHLAPTYDEVPCCGMGAVLQQ